MTTAPVCAAPDCDRVVYARRHCEKHYRQLLRRSALSPERLAAQTCAASACARSAVVRGWCQAHYLRWVRTGDVREDDPLRGKGAPPCTVDGCSNRNHARGLCRTHLRRLSVLGDLARDVPVRTPGSGYVHRGYRVVPVPPDLRHLVGGAVSALEHRLVMSVLLDRSLLRHEVVHHRNGDRADNRPDNLELWSTAQPKGQRVADKVAFAKALLQLYEPSALAEPEEPAAGRSGLSSGHST